MTRKRTISKKNLRFRRYRKVNKLISQRRNEVLNEIQLEDDTQRVSQLNMFNMNEPKLNESIGSWVKSHGITTRAVNDLLRLMNKAGVAQLPKDYRTLMKTPKTMEIVEKAGGKYWYNGIERNLQLIFSKLNENISIKLNFNMDGLPVFKSSQCVFWPILSSIHKMPHIRPMIISIWCGMKKPNNLTEYLEPFVIELKRLMQNGIWVNGYHIAIAFRCCICDSPARAFIKGTVNFNHTNGCQKCKVTGSKSAEAKRMYYAEIGCSPRTDIEFRNREHSSHHKERSVLEELEIDMIKAFPTSDPLHLFELGIMKRLLKVWLFGDVGYGRKWLKIDIVQINTLLRDMNKDKPREIHRSIRCLDDFKFWKGTEFRSFLLYYGIAVLKNYLPEDVYRHFLILVCATTICYTDVYRVFLPLSKIWFSRYIENYADIYGIHSIGSNVHLLNHVCDDVEMFGNLNDISTYAFENRLNFLKLRLKQPNLPLEQISRRIVELSLDYDDFYSCSIKNVAFPQYKHSEIRDGTQIFKEIIINGDCTFSSKRIADSWILTYSLEIFQFKYVMSTGNAVHVYGTPVPRLENFFTYPLSSSLLNIFKSDGKSETNLMSFNLNEIKAKMLRLKSCDDFVFIPLLHTLKK
ncbi:uncharacterized protein LOC129571070 [Sitodiplosis mosellana]|uniref:uncharacterized protein LOC129571070 n=1 Tax=Sitodiplosis mosellana TaxID=263140 RepID=UPI0024448CF0|nr:uncharacterized protein LOC129571070 [Sitodiplosis mosellana]